MSVNVYNHLKFIAKAYLDEATNMEDVDIAIEIAMQRVEEFSHLAIHKQDEAVALFAAYLLAKKKESGVNLNGVQSEKEGDLSRSYFGAGQGNAPSDQFMSSYLKLIGKAKQVQVCRG